MRKCTDMPNESFLYGLEKSNHDFTKEKSFGKNIFTNAFPISLSMYMAKELNLKPNYLKAAIGSDGIPVVQHTFESLDSILDTTLDKASWAFEDSFSGYDRYATGTVNRSDLVVRNSDTEKQTRAFEVKLVAAPTSGTANRKREEQSCEIVVRPPTIEQMCFSIVASFGPKRRHDIGDIIANCLKRPMDYNWSNETYMLEKLPFIINAADEMIREGVDFQTPFVLNALWRTVGKSTVFDDECFDVFFWSDFAFLQLFTNAAKKAVDSAAKTIGRPARSVIWLIKSLFDYSAQGTVTFERTHSDISYGGQTDKAGAFSGNSVMKFIGCKEFYHPRVSKEAYQNIISPEGIALLSPERRLDGFIKTDYDYRVVELEDNETGFKD